MAQRLRADIWAHPFQEDVVMIREVWMGGSTDDGYWPTDHAWTADRAEQEIAYLKNRPRTDVHDHRPDIFPFKIER